MTNIAHFTWLVVALPAAGAAILLLGGRRTDPWGHLLGCATALASFGVGVKLLVDMLGWHGDARTISQNLFSWVPVGNLHVDFGLQIDQLSICFVLLITAAIGAMILAHRERFERRKTQRELSIERFRPGGHPTPMPSPGVYARHNAVDMAARLPDGSYSRLSVPQVLEQRTADELEVHARGSNGSKNGAS